jgi:hypothetical protein
MLNPSPGYLVLKPHEQRSNMMRTLMIAATAALALAAGVPTASAGDELDTNVGAGAYLHPTGPVNGVGHQGGK